MRFQHISNSMQVSALGFGKSDGMTREQKLELLKDI
jgi:hypothetical protein